MPVEIEAKMKADDFDVVRDRLAACGARPSGRVLEVNTFFDTPDRSLLAEDRGLRLRQMADLNGVAAAYVITHKGPRKHGRVKRRDEVEVVVANPDDATALIESLGFTRVLRFEKRRTSFELDDCAIELDELPHLGTFVEIEGPSEPAVLRVRDRLNLGDRPLISASYIALLVSYLQETGDPNRDVRFAP